ncbi:hypothetical protein CDL12_01690 [Handroanthus impetiginosus]|uniref:Uncharacterized protein n=1 Tax=Handroanthus impetiginosus TaxID=429701 RepID=A0A2G9I718_9LAMI|nr:hypothetical protein CDL12_01690 [Handroanthus impetiginosus]
MCIFSSHLYVDFLILPIASVGFCISFHFFPFSFFPSTLFSFFIEFLGLLIARVHFCCGI